MQINILEVFSNDILVEDIEKEFRVDSIKYNGENVLLKEPVTIKCHFKKVDENEIILEGHINTILGLFCDRCNKDVNYVLDTDFFKDIRLKDQSKDDDDDFIVGHYLDLEKLAFSEIYINYPMKVLCKEDCLGICKQCGQNLNEGKCDCNNDDVDPRLAGLKALFDDNFKEV